ncbi:MAG: mechanosensitive ion channel family protein [Candidatus Limnocylindria bacterium]
MLDLPNLPASVEVILQLALIAVAALVAFVVLRSAVGIGMRHLLERRSQEASAGVLSPAELEKRVQTIGRLIVRIAGSVIAVIAVLMALQLFGIDIGPAVAGLGVVGIAVGFGAQTVVRDWLAGIFIVLENQYSQGDVVRIAGVEGVVEDFSLRRTTLRDLDGAVHTVPNGQILVTSNITRVPARVTLEMTVAAADVERATEIIDRVGDEFQADPAWRARLVEPPAVVGVQLASDGTATLKVLGRARAADQLAVGEELRTLVLAALAEAGIEVRHPDRVVVGRGDAADGDEAADPEETTGA